MDAKQKFQHHFTYVLSSLLMVFILSVEAIAKAPSSNAPSFEFMQLTHMLNQYDELIAKSDNELLSSLNLSNEDISLLVKGLVSIGRGELLETRVECAGIKDRVLEESSGNPNWFFSKATPSQRLDVLSKAGPIALWSWLLATESFEKPQMKMMFNNPQKKSQKCYAKECIPFKTPLTG